METEEEVTRQAAQEARFPGTEDHAAEESEVPKDIDSEMPWSRVPFRDTEAEMQRGYHFLNMRFNRAYMCAGCRAL